MNVGHELRHPRLLQTGFRRREDERTSQIRGDGQNLRGGCRYPFCSMPCENSNALLLFHKTRYIAP